jgi:hypothetical protein
MRATATARGPSPGKSLSLDAREAALCPARVGAPRRTSGRDKALHRPSFLTHASSSRPSGKVRVLAPPTPLERPGLHPALGLPEPAFRMPVSSRAPPPPLPSLSPSCSASGAVWHKNLVRGPRGRARSASSPPTERITTPATWPHPSPAVWGVRVPSRSPWRPLGGGGHGRAGVSSREEPCCGPEGGVGVRLRHDIRRPARKPAAFGWVLGRLPPRRFDRARRRVPGRGGAGGWGGGVRGGGLSGGVGLVYLRRGGCGGGLRYWAQRGGGGRQDMT